MRNKLMSRKFWISVAAFLGSIAASVAGLASGEKWITITGVVCGMLSAAIYAAAEAYTDGAHKNEDE
jgi:drug/metabolite transporter (DMT)-like permease